MSKFIENRINEVKEIISTLEYQNLCGSENIKQSFYFGISVSLEFMLENINEIKSYLKGDTDELKYK